MKTKETNPTRPGSPTPCKQALKSLNTSFFHGSSNQALWNIHTAVSPSGIDTEWEASREFLPPLTQLITKCKRRTKITRKMKRAKQSHCYYPNSVATDRLVLAGDVKTNPGPDDAKTGRKKSVQNITVKKSCLTCNKTVRLNQKELTCNIYVLDLFITNAKREN